MSWNNIGLNPYGVIVQENEQGIRRYQSSGGWLTETNETISVCRATTNEEIIIAAKAMSNINISKSYKHNASICALVWLTPKGVSVKINDNVIEKVKKHPKGIALKKHIENEIGKRVLFLWMAKSKWNNDLPKWSYTINMKSPTLNRGLQIGVAKIIQDRFNDDLWTEIGLINSSDSSCWILPATQRKIYANKIDESLSAPFAVQQSVMIPFDKPIVKNKKNVSFGTISTGNNDYNNQQESSSFFNIYTNQSVKKLLWVTLRSVKIFGWENLLSWKDWYEKEETEGIVVFENKDLEKKYKLYDILESKGIERFEIKNKDQETNIVYIISNVKYKNNKIIDIKDWAGDQPEIYIPKFVISEDEFGRVPYRALSKVGKPVGMIPKRLEENIHEALMELERKYGDIDKLISKAMGFKKKELGDYVSAEQVDAIAMFYDAFSKKQDALLADETGFGKGRILASLVKIGLRMGKTVVFITENSQLFSDFYRDMTDVYGEGLDVIPTMLHGKAKIINPKGELVAKMTFNTKPYKKMIETKSFEKKEVPLIFTTYSQINKENKKESNIKVEWLKSRMKQNPNGCWLILDEAHNAAGDSNINNNLEQLLKYSDGCLFSSATFAKTENNLSVYKRVMNLPKWLYQLLNNAIENDSGELRESLTTMMAKKGNFIRREHKPIDPPAVQWIELDDEKERYLKVFADFWRSLHHTMSIREKAAGGFYGFAWAKLGSYLSRTIKEFSFLMKIEDHITKFTELLASDIKPVLAVESTFESAFRSVLEKDLEILNEDDDEEENIEGDDEDSKKEKSKRKTIPLNGVIVDHIPLWKERLALIVEKSVDMEDFLSTSPSNKDVEHVKQLQEETLKILEDLPDWDLMPLEKILRRVKENGYNVGELSGRMYTYEKTEDGKFKIVLMNKPNRVELVNDFNSGVIDFLTITLAGCTGISVHAGAKFKDQRKRALFEGDIAVNTAKRIQFWGRVRRKDQVVEPLFLRLALSILSEKRTQAREDKKKETLAAHVGMKQDFESISWISAEGEQIAEEWAIERKDFAMKIGILNPIEGNPFGRVDRALLRSIILPVEEQEGILNRLDRGLYLMKDVAKRERNVGKIRKSRKIREGWLLGHPSRNSEDPRDPLSLPRINFVERVYERNEQTDFDNMCEYIKNNNSKEVSGHIVMEKWKNAWLYEKNASNIINPQYHGEIWNWIEKVLPYCEKGNTIEVTRPGESDIIKGVVLGFDYPDCEGKGRGASSWSLSQVAIKVWLIGENEPILIPLLRLFKDLSFRVSKEKANMGWFKEVVTPFIGISVEGNPVLSAYWSKIWKVGRAVLINDEDEGLKWIWSLPKLWNWDAMKNLPKIALNLRQIYNCLISKVEKDMELIAVTPSDRFITAKSVNDSAILFNVDRKTFDEAFNSWANPVNRKMFGKINYNGKDQYKRKCVSFSIQYRDIMRIFGSIDKTGIIWQIKNCSEQWYRDSSAKIMDEAIIENEKILNPNKKKSAHQQKNR